MASKWDKCNSSSTFKKWRAEWNRQVLGKVLESQNKTVATVAETLTVTMASQNATVAKFMRMQVQQQQITQQHTENAYALYEFTKGSRPYQYICF
jgi:hypothetical protein